jgi:hypothetical protein
MPKLSLVLAGLAVMSVAAFVVPRVEATASTLPASLRAAIDDDMSVVEPAALKCAHRRVCRPGQGCAWRKVCKRW